MKKILYALICISIICAVFSACSSKTTSSSTVTTTNIQNTTTSDNSDIESTKIAQQNSPIRLEQTTAVSNSSKSANYNNNFESDKKSFNPNKIDITVGDNYFMTQINDWYTNFGDYEGKTVEIEGLFEQFGSYYYVGRNGPSCQYCTGGMVTFEIHSDYDYSTLVVNDSWIKVQGILKKGTDVDENGKSFDFYYIEAINIDIMPEHGMSTVTN